MALRKIAEHLFVGGADAMQPDKLLACDADFILRLDPKCPTDHAVSAEIEILDAFIPDELVPSAKDINYWLLALTPLKENKNVLVVSRGGQNRACTVGSVLKALHENRPWGAVLTELHEQFLLQGVGHNWWPYQNWRDAISKYWRTIIGKPEATSITEAAPKKPAIRRRAAP